MTKEQKEALLVGGVVAGGALLVWLMSGKGAVSYQGPSLSLGGSPGGNVSFGGSGNPPAISFPGISIPALTTGSAGQNTPANVSTGTPQCGCEGIGLNQGYYGGPAAAAAALAPIALAALAAAQGGPSNVPSWALNPPNVGPSAAPPAPRIGTTKMPSPGATTQQLTMASLDAPSPNQPPIVPLRLSNKTVWSYA